MPIRRRHFLSAAGLLASGCSLSPRPLPPLPDAGPLSVTDHDWLNRLSWGASDSAARAVQLQGRERWVDEQLRPAPWPGRLPDAVQATIDTMTLSRVPLPELALRMREQRRAADALTDPEAKAAALKTWQQDMTRLAREAASRQLLRALYTPRQLQDQMGWFWLNHFNVHGYKADLRLWVGDYDERLHTLALGRFRDLLGAVVFHPAMLRYLDNDQNAAGHLNENLGRELLELHTLGVDGGYSQQDVQELARVLTGLGVVNARDDEAQRGRRVRRGLAEFTPARHDAGPKQLLGQMVGGEGVAEIDGVLDRLARHPATAHHVCRKIAQFLVAEPPPPDLVGRMAESFLRHDGHIAEVLRTLLAAPEFAASLGLRFKDPMHFVLSAVRQAFDGRIVVNTDPLLYWLQRLGQAPYAHTTPDGYALDSMAWTGPGQLTTRFEVARIIGSGAPRLFHAEGDTPAEPPPPAQLRGALFEDVWRDRLSPATREALAQAGNQRDWNSFWLSSPEFMQR